MGQVAGVTVERELQSPGEGVQHFTIVFSVVSVVPIEDIETTVGNFFFCLDQLIYSKLMHNIFRGCHKAKHVKWHKFPDIIIKKKTNTFFFFL